METDEAVERSDRALRQTLMDLQADIKDLLVVDYDQVQWQAVAELAQTAATIVQIIQPGPNDIE